VVIYSNGGFNGDLMVIGDLMDDLVVI